MTGIDNIKVDRRRIMHDVGIVLTSENISCASHICGQLVDFIESAIDNLSAHILIAQVADYKIICRGFRKLRIFEIDTPDPEPVVS